MINTSRPNGVNEELSITPQAVVEDTGQISISPVTPAAVVGPETARDRALKAHLALRDQSPGIEALTAGILAGKEDEYRHQAYVQSELDFKKQKLNALQQVSTASEGPLSDDEREFILGMSQTDFSAFVESPETIWETEYGKEFINKISTMDNDLLDRVMGEDPTTALDAMDASSFVIARQEIARKIVEDLQADIEQSSWGEYIPEFIGNLVPVLPWYRTQNAINEAAATSFLPGNNMQEQFEYLWSLPPSQFHRELKMAVDDIATRNKQTALYFASSALSFSTSDQFLGNIVGIADIADVASLGAIPLATGAARAGGAAVRSVKRIGGRAIDVTKATASAAFEPLKATPLERFKKVITDSHQAMMKPKADVGDALAGAGDMMGAARHDVLAETVRGGEALRDFRAQDPLNQGRRFAGRLPSIFQPDTFMAGAKAFSRETTERLQATMNRNAANILTALTRPARAERLSVEALEAGFNAAEVELRRRFTHANDRVIDVVRVQPEDNLAGIAAVAIRMGKPSGELFKTPGQAWANARVLGLEEAQYNIRQQGAGYYIEVYKPVTETSDIVRDSLIKGTNVTPTDLVNEWLGFLRSSQDTLSPQQSLNRGTTVHSATEVQRLMKEVASDIGSLSKGERTNMRRIFEKNRDFIDPVSGDRGMFYDTVADFQDAYLKEFNRMPTEKEVAAYFAFRQISDFDYMVRNLGLVRDKARQGIENVRYKFKTADAENPGQFTSQDMYFEGKSVSDLPWSNPEDAGIWIEGIDRMVRKNTLLPDDKEYIRRLVEEKGYKVIQVANPDSLPLASRIGREDTINFVIVPDAQFSPLKWDQLPYKPGGHVEYAAEAYVKQPTISRIGEDPASMVHHYRGDASILGFRTMAEARKYAPKLDQARLLLKENRINDLKKYLDDNLPFDFDEFKGMFEPRVGPDGKQQRALLSLEEPIVAVSSGRNALDEIPDLASRYANFRNDVRSSYNLYQNIDKKFAGERSGPLKTVVEEIGADHNPILRLADAPTIDPFASLERTTANVIRNRFLNDYKIGAVESWMSEFKDLLTEFRLQGGPERISADPIYYLHNAIFDEAVKDTARLAAAKSSRDAILHLIGTPGPVQQKINHMTTRLMDSIYNKAGQKAVEFTQEHLLAREVDPFRFMRSVAFHSKLGLFNWQQFFVNAQSLTHVLGVAGPVNAVPSMAAATMMQFLRINARPQMIDKMADMAQKMGYSRATFIESFDELKRTGYWNIEGETAWKNVIDYNITEGAGGKFLDWGTTFFKESERLIRLSAWNTAFLEYRKANPTKAITNRTRQEILQRADLLAVNMTRASNASWQNGVFSVPTQFLSYQIRLTEQFLGKRLTKGEKLRAIATYGAMYGLPATASAATAYPFYEATRKEALEKGWDLSNPIMHAMHEGLVSLLLKYITGEDIALTQRYAPGGLPLFDQLDADSPLEAMMEIFLGASGSIMHDIIKTFDPFAHALTSIFSEENEQFPLKANDFLEPLTNISSVNNITKMLWALNTGRFITKNEIYIGDATPFQAIFNGITGLMPSEVNDAFLMQRSIRDVTSAQREAEKQVIKNLRLAFAKMADGDQKGFDDYLRRARVYLIAGGFQPNQWSKILAEAAGGNNSLVNEARMRFIMRAPANQFQPRLDRELERGRN
jgi:hypothetical protein